MQTVLDMLDFLDIAICIVLLLIVLSYTWLIVLVGKSAAGKGRSVIGWVLLSIIFSPLLSAIFLLCLGETSEHKRERLAEEERIRARIREDFRKQSVN